MTIEEKKANYKQAIHQYMDIYPNGESAKRISTLLDGFEQLIREQTIEECAKTLEAAKVDNFEEESLLSARLVQDVLRDIVPDQLRKLKTPTQNN